MDSSLSDDEATGSSMHSFHGQRWTTPPPPTPDKILKTLEAPISPPRRKFCKRGYSKDEASVKTGRHDIDDSKEKPSSASTEIEARKIPAKDYLNNWIEQSETIIEDRPERPLLSIERFVDLYRRNQNQHGHHFVIHQHDHPIAGLHYDLRLQISGSSSISYAIMYGLPGNPNSQRLNRNATETRVHNMWNHLVESASFSSGSLLIWDTGEYSILPYRQKGKQTDDELSEELDRKVSASSQTLSDPQKLHQAFHQRKIRIRLHGTRLGPNYVLSMRLQSSNNRFAQPEKPVRKRQRNATRKKKQETPTTSDHDDYTEALDDRVPNADMALNPHTSTYEQELEEQENERVRLTNAYPGATNSINSIHQRTWYLSMDRLASGFALSRDKYGTKVWVRKQEGEKLAGFEPFFVRGKEIERSIVTGRLSADIYDDDGIKGFVGRKGWRPVLE